MIRCPEAQGQSKTSHLRRRQLPTRKARWGGITVGTSSACSTEPSRHHRGPGSRLSNSRHDRRNQEPDSRNLRCHRQFIGSSHPYPFEERFGVACPQLASGRITEMALPGCDGVR